MDIRQFIRNVPLPGPSSLQPLPAGMLNHGSTCYLGAILKVSSAAKLPTGLTLQLSDAPAGTEAQSASILLFFSQWSLDEPASQHM
jgi:hypothetical protein